MVDRPGFEPGASASWGFTLLVSKACQDGDLPLIYRPTEAGLDKAGPCVVFACPAIFADATAYTKSAGGTPFLSDVIGTASTASAANVRFLVSLSKGWCSFTHSSSLALFRRLFSRGFS